jgi:hypothetical protein
MKITTKALLAAAGFAALAFSPANAYEGTPFATQPGVFIGSSAGVPPPGIYMFNQVFTDQLNISGPGTQQKIPLNGNLTLGNNNSQHATEYAAGFLFVPGWTFLGATYNAVVVQPFLDVGIGNPLGAVTIAGTPVSPISVASGVFNTYIVPVELSWKLGNSGFAVKTGFGVFVPDGTHTGVNGLGNVGNPWYTFQPELIVSYLAGGYNLTAALYEEFNTANTNDNYTNGNVFHADFTATKTFGKWTLGPVAHYVAQVTDDSCPVGVCTTAHPPKLPPLFPVPITLGGTLANTQRYSVFSVGGLVEYNFGPASLSVWATQDVSAKASNSAAAALGADNSLIGRGFTVFSTLSYRLWAPEEPAKTPLYHK